MTVARLEIEMDVREFLEWRAFFKIENEEEEQRILQARAEAGLKK